MSQHIAGKRTYFLIFGTLLLFTGLTVAAAYQEMGPLNNLVALGIAVTKATLVVLFFMHARYSSRLTRLVIIAALAWLLMLFVFVLSDYMTRGWLPFPGK